MRESLTERSFMELYRSMNSWARSQVGIASPRGTTQVSGVSIASRSMDCSSAVSSKLEAQETAVRDIRRTRTRHGNESRTAGILGVMRGSRQPKGPKNASSSGQVLPNGTIGETMRFRATIARGLAALFLAVLTALLAACPCWAIDCTRDSTGMVPLIDLGSGTYFGFEGGLYAGGSNHRPAAHDAAGLSIAQSIGPLDTLGMPDPAGRGVLISIGMSNAKQEFSTFVPKAMADPLKKPDWLLG